MVDEAPIAIIGHERDPPSWADEVGAVRTSGRVHPLPEPIRTAARNAPCLLLDGNAPDAVETAQELHAADAAIQIVIVAPLSEHPRIRREVMFAPGLGEVWVILPEEVTAGVVKRASRVTRQRREHRATRASLVHHLARIEPVSARRAVISDAYLATLLDVLPNPVISIDDNGRILSWSPAAERVLGYSRSAAVGRDLPRLLAPGDSRALSSLLSDPGSPARGEVRFRREGGDMGIALVAVAPVEVEGYPVRAVFLQDLTQERRAQSQLEELAAELEIQAESLQVRASQLEESQLELERTNRELRRTNEELAARTEEADQARVVADESRREAEAANRAKSDFLATMSHEIRTPINAILGYTDLLEIGVGGGVTDEQKAKLGRIKSSSRHLLALVDDVLDLAKVEAGRLTVEPERAIAADAVGAALALVRPLAVQRGIEIHHERPQPDHPSYVGDEDRVRQILVNLLSNSIKFTEPGGRISIDYGADQELRGDSEEGPWTCIRVTDTGIGISSEESGRIFRAFEQVEQGHTRTRGGTGLGLTISRKLARLMGGDLTVESEPGEGSTFTLWLPAETTILAPIDESVLAELLGPAELPRGLAAAGTTLQMEARSLLDDHVDRLRTEPRIPGAAELGDADVADHTLSFLADLGHALVSLEKSRVAPDRLLRDGGEIQRLIAELHGSQRAQLGWTEDALHAELEILRDGIERVVAQNAPDEVDVDGVMRVLGRFLERSNRITVLAWRRASAVPGFLLPDEVGGGGAPSNPPDE